MSFCADPPPRAVRWEWGTMVLLEVIISLSFYSDLPPQAVRWEWGIMVPIDM